MTAGGQQPGSAEQRWSQIPIIGQPTANPRPDAASASTDEELMGQLAAGDTDALGPLYGRYVGLVFRIAGQSLDHSAAEDLVQEVFLVVWRKASTFDPGRGAFRPWLLEIAHTRVLNELRRRGRRPRLLPDQGDDQLRLVADTAPEPVESVVRGQRHDAIDEALVTLPTEQEQALRLAFFAEMTHEEVAATTAVPLGTAKSRIRTGLRRLRSQLNPLLVGGVALVLVASGTLYQHEHEESVRYSQALTHVTMSDVETVRLVAADGAPVDAHGIYRARDGADIAVLTVSNLPAPATGRVYQAWVEVDGTWRPLGIVPPASAEGRSLLIAQGADLGAQPEALMVTEEPTGGARQPSDRVMIVWRAP